MRLPFRTRRPRVDRPFRCRDVALVLQPYLDGEIDDLTVRRVREHLEACRDCGLEASTYRRIKDSLARQVDLPEDALERLAAFAEDLATGRVDAPIDLDGDSGA